MANDVEHLSMCLLTMCISLEITPVVFDEKSALILIAAPVHLICLFSVAALIFFLFTTHFDQSIYGFLYFTCAWVQ